LLSARVKDNIYKVRRLPNHLKGDRSKCRKGDNHFGNAKPKLQRMFRKLERFISNLVQKCLPLFKCLGSVKDSISTEDAKQAAQTTSYQNPKLLKFQSRARPNHATVRTTSLD